MLELAKEEEVEDDILARIMNDMSEYKKMEETLETERVMEN